jgi:flagellar motor protein MotB
MTAHRPIATLSAALALFAAHGGCVSVEEHTQVAEQLSLEQRHARDAADRQRQLEILVERLQKQLRLCELERDEAREKLTLERKRLPGGVGTEKAGEAPRAARDAAVLVGTIQFQAGQESLSEQDRQKLAEIASTLGGLAGGDVVVAGHSDPTPINRTRHESNMHLSSVRALAVYHELVKMERVAPERVYVVAYGEHRPAADGKRLRRVEILFVPSIP